MHFFKKIKILRKIKVPNLTYLSSPNSLISSIPYQYTPFSQPKLSYGAKKSKNVKKRHFTPIFAPKVPHIMFFRKNVTRVFALSQKVSGELAKFQRDLTYSFRELDFFCKKRIKGKCSFEPTGPLPLSLLNAIAGRGGHLAPSRSRDLFLFWEFSETKREPGHASTSHHVLKQIRGLLRIPTRSAPFGRKCQCSINFARWKFFKEKFW